MEYWEITEDRAMKTLPVWQTHVPTLKVTGFGADEFEDLFDQFEAKAQERTEAQDVLDTAVRVARTALLKMKILGIKVPQIIDGQLSSDAGILADLERVFRVSPRTETTIRARARALHPVWVKADAILAALTPALPPITRRLQGVDQTAASLDALDDGYPALLKMIQAKEEILNGKRTALRTLDRQVDLLNKNFYQIVKNMFDPGSPEYEALSGIPAEGGQPGPEGIDIDQLVQGGDDGLHVLVSYEAGGGDHATTKEVEYKVEGVDADFGHAVALDASGNLLGPFVVAQVVKVRTKVSNSAGTRTSAVRTITIEEPL